MLGLIISIGIFLVYVLGICIGFGYIPNSISASYYWLENRHRSLGILFTLFCWGTAVPIMPYLLGITSEDYQFLTFIACAALAFVGAAPLFKDSAEGRVHKGATTVAMAAIATWIILTHWWVLLLAVASYAVGIIIHMAANRIAISDPYYINKVKPLFWAECTVYAATYLTAILG